MLNINIIISIGNNVDSLIFDSILYSDITLKKIMLLVEKSMLHEIKKKCCDAPY